MDSVRRGVRVDQGNDDGDHLPKVDREQDETEEKCEDEAGLLQRPRVERSVLERCDDAENQKAGSKRNAQEC